MMSGINGWDNRRKCKPRSGLILRESELAKELVSVKRGTDQNAQSRQKVYKSLEEADCSVHQVPQSRKRSGDVGIRRARVARDRKCIILRSLCGSTCAMQTSLGLFAGVSQAPNLRECLGEPSKISGARACTTPPPSTVQKLPRCCYSYINRAPR
jgi:hypothetical protein